MFQDLLKHVSSVDVFLSLRGLFKGFQLLVFGGGTQFVCVDHCFANFSKARLVSLRRNWSQGTLWSQRLPTDPLVWCVTVASLRSLMKALKKVEFKAGVEGKTEKIIVGIWFFGSVWYYVLLLGGKKIDILHTSRALECFAFKLIYYSKLRQIRDAVNSFPWRSQRDLLNTKLWEVLNRKNFGDILGWLSPLK